MKRYFGSPLLRTLRGGVLLRREEHQVVTSMVAELPDHLRSKVESQFNEYNIVQREVDGRALNFYKMSLFSAKTLQLQASLLGTVEEAPLIRVSVAVPDEVEPLRATMSAISGRAFCVSFSRPVPKASHEQPLKVTKVIHAWKSAFPAQ